MTNDLLLEVKDLHIDFFTNEGVVRAVDGVDLSVRRGKTLCVVGESGCGKSVTVLSVLQIVHSPGRIVSGETLFYRSAGSTNAATTTDIIDIAKMSPRGREIRRIRGKEIAMVFQEPMTSLSLMDTIGNQIGEAIRLHFKCSKAEARERSIGLLRRVGIPRPEQLIDEYSFRLSGGMCQRAMIAMALSCNPRLLIADEPTTALDVTTQAQILDLMLELQQQYSMTLLYITHDLGVVAEIADDVAVMYLGNVVESSDVDTIFNNPKHPYTQALLRSIPKIGPTRTRLDAIEGMVPSPFRRPTGCPFHSRCAQAIVGVCDVQTPPKTAVAENHEVRCLLYGGATNTIAREGEQ